MPALPPPRGQSTLTLGCEACGELIDSKLLRDGDVCPACRTGKLKALDGDHSHGAQSVMLAWLLREASDRLTGFGLVFGAVTGLVVAAILAYFVRGAWGALLFGYLGVTGALAGSAWAAPLYRALGGRSYVEMRQTGTKWALGLWVVVPLACVGGLWLLGGHGAWSVSIRRGLGLLMASFTN